MATKQEIRETSRIVSQQAIAKGRLDLLSLDRRPLSARQQEIRDIAEGRLPAKGATTSPGAPDVPSPLPPPLKPVSRFSSFGEQLLSIREAAINETCGRRPDPRLIELNTRAASGGSEAVPADGGFLIAPEFSESIVSRIYAQGLLLSRFTYIPVTIPRANAITIPGFDEQSRADGSRWGGVRGYWANEAGTVTASRPKYRAMELLLKKLLATSTVTDELLEDAATLGAAMQIAFSNELTFKLEYASLFGTGSGQPLGMLSAGNNALIVTPKEAGQAGSTLTSGNLIAMYSSLWGPSRRNGLWLMSESVDAQLIKAFVAAKNVAASENVGGWPLYVPANSDDDFPRILGRPAVVIEGMAALGTQSDIAFVDASQYVFSDKQPGGPDFATSMHVNFLTDESVFRVSWRVDGQPMWHAPLTPYGGGAALSAYVTLATRS